MKTASSTKTKMRYVGLASFPADLYARIRIEAIKQGTSAPRIFEAAMADHMDRIDSAASRKQGAAK